MQNIEGVRVVILAAGKSTRMKSDLPKALVPLRGKPMIRYVVEAAEAVSAEKPIVVVGHQAELVKEELANSCEYALQAEQLGTAHAVLSAKEKCVGAENILVLYTDHPLITAGTIKKLVEKHAETRAKISLATATVPDFSDWREFLYTNFSRILRDQSGRIVKDVQFRDATDAEKKITEINPCYFCFDTTWLWEKLKYLNKDNDQGQYYLTDLIAIAVSENSKIETINIDPREALGANSRKELEILEGLMIK